MLNILSKPAMTRSKKEFVMPAFLDLTNQRFGNLVCILRANLPPEKPKWRCLCDCGNQCIVSRNDLRSGDSKSCGCLRKNNLMKNLTGEKFGKLIVLYEGRKRGKSSSTFWECVCDCGKNHCVSAQHLTLGQIKSCGCLKAKSDDLLLEEAKKRFFILIDKREECWNWKGSIQKGYGVLFFKKQIKAHRFSYMIHVGELEKGKLICHHCDNPLCVNPDHLYQGTHQDNSNDMVKRGRHRSQGNSQPLSCCAGGNYGRF